MKQNKTQTTKAKTEDGRPYVSARVDQASLDNCNQLASNFNWSLSQMINFAMSNVKKEDVLKTFDNGK